MAKSVKYILKVDAGKAVRGIKKTGNAALQTAAKFKLMAKSAKKAFSAMKGSIAMVVGGMAALALAPIVAIKAFMKLGQAVADSINDLNDLSNTSGLAAKSIEGLRLAFEASGQSAGKANSLLARIPKLMNDIALNVGDASKASKAFGFSLVDSSGNAKSADRVFRELVELLGHIEDKTKKAQVAFMFFGRQGAALLQSLGDSKNLEKFIELANRFGVDVGPKASKAAADMQLNMAILRLMWQKFKQTLLDSLGGMEGVNKLLISMGGWIVWASKILETKKGSWKNFADWAVYYMGRIVNAINIVIRFIEILHTVLKTLGNVVTSLNPFTTVHARLGAMSELWHGALRTLGVEADETGVKVGAFDAKVKALGLSTNEADKAMADFISSMKDGGITSSNTNSVLNLTEEAITELNDSATALTSGLGTLKEEVKGAGQAASGAAKDFQDLEKRLNDALNFVSERDKDFEMFSKRIEDASISTKDFLNRLGEMRKEKTPLSEITDKFSDLRNEAAGIAKDLDNADVGKYFESFLKHTSATKDDLIVLNSEFDRLLLKGPFQLNEESFLKQVDKVLSEIENREKIKLKADIQVKKVEGIANFINQLLSGLSSPGGLVTSLTEGLGTAIGKIFGSGPVGGAIGGMFGGMINSIADLGRKSPEEVRQEFENFIKAFKAGIDMLPMVFEEIMPPFLAALMKGIGSMLYTFALVLARMFVRGIGGIFKSLIDFWSNPGANLKSWFSGIWTWIKNTANAFFQDIVSLFTFRSGGRVPSGRQGLRMTQGTGMALLHPNEYVVPQSGMKPQAVERTLDQINSGQQGTTININSIVTERNAIDELVRMIERRYQSFGTSRSTLFAS